MIFAKCTGETPMPLSDDLADNFAFDIGQPEIAALESIGEARVIEAQEMKNGGLQIVYVYTVAGDVKAEFIGFTVCDSGFDATAGKPHRE